MKLVLYADGSPESEAFQSFLESRGLVFELVDARTPDGLRRLRFRTRQDRVPALEIIRSHSLGVLVGFDEERVGIELGLKKIAP